MVIRSPTTRPDIQRTSNSPPLSQLSQVSQRAEHLTPYDRTSGSPKYMPHRSKPHQCHNHLSPVTSAAKTGTAGLILFLASCKVSASHSTHAPAPALEPRPRYPRNVNPIMGCHATRSSAIADRSRPSVVATPSPRWRPSRTQPGAHHPPDGVCVARSSFAVARLDRCAVLLQSAADTYA